MDRSESARLKRGFAIAARITREHSHTFYFASRFLPGDKKAALYAAYAICRLSDDAVDQDGPDKQRRLDRIKEQIELCYGKEPVADDLLIAFRHTVSTYDIPKTYFDELILGMEMDLRQARYRDFNQLYSYCYRAAGVVGLIILSVFGNKNEEARRHAVELGVAVQLTNILRDIKEDLARGRIYLPGEEMRRYGIIESALKNAVVDDAFKEFMAFQVRRARQFYERSEKGIPLIRSYLLRLVILAIKENYAKILDDMQRHGYDVFSRRAHVGAAAKIFALFGQLIRAV